MKELRALLWVFIPFALIVALIAWVGHLAQYKGKPTCTCPVPAN